MKLMHILGGTQFIVQQALSDELVHVDFYSHSQPSSAVRAFAPSEAYLPYPSRPASGRRLRLIVSCQLHGKDPWSI